VTQHVLIAHTDQDNTLAEELSQSLKEHGFKAICESTISVGDSVVESVRRELEAGSPVVVCATIHALGTGWVHQVANAARRYDRSKIFVVQIEEKAHVAPISFGDKVLLYYENPTGAMDELVKALQKFYPRESEHGISHEYVMAHVANIESSFKQHMLANAYTTSEEDIRYMNMVVSKVADKPKKESQSELKEGPLGAFVAQDMPLLLLGDGGGGKTTSLLWYAAQKARLATSDGLIPVYLELKRFDVKQDGFSRLITMLTNATQLGLSEEDFLSLWRTGKQEFIFILDGFNEVPDEFRSICAIALGEFFQKKYHMYLISSRAGPVSELLCSSLLKTEKVQQFPLEPMQVEEYLRENGLAEVYVRMGARLKDLARNPFMLMSLVKSCSGTSRYALPQNVGQLYRNFVDRHIFVERESGKPANRYSYQEVKRPVLAAIASDMTEKGSTTVQRDMSLNRNVETLLKSVWKEVERLSLMPREWSTQEFIDELVSNGVLRQSDNTMSFMHQSVQEYFTAIALHSLPMDGVVSRMPKLILRHIDPESYQSNHETEHSYVVPTVMLCGLMPDSSDFISLLAMHNPIISARCLVSASHIRQELKDLLRNNWLELASSKNIRHQHVGCTCLGEAGFSDDTVKEKLLNLAFPPDGRKYGEPHARETALQALLLLDRGNTTALAVPKLIESLVDKKLSDWEVETPLNMLDQRKTVQLLLDRLLDTTSDGDQDQHYAQRLLASMNRDLVVRELNAMLEDAVGMDVKKCQALNDVLENIASWSSMGLNIPNFHEIRKKQNKAFEVRKRNCEERIKKMKPLDNAEVVQMLSSKDALDRSAAATILGSRQAQSACDALAVALTRELDQSNLEILGNALSSCTRDADHLVLIVNNGLVMSDAVWLFSCNIPMPQHDDTAHMVDLPKALIERMENEGIRHCNGPYRRGDAVIISESGANYFFQSYQIISTPTGTDVFALNARRKMLYALAGLPRSRAIDELCQHLTHSVGDIRETTVKLLKELRAFEVADQVADALLCETDDTGTFEAAISFLRSSETDVAVNALTQLLLKICEKPPVWLMDRSPSYEEGIHDALKALVAESEVLCRMRKALNNPDDNIRSAAANEMERWAESRIREERETLKEESQRDDEIAVELILNDPDIRVQTAAASMLRWSKSDEGIHDLIKALHDEDPQRRCRAARALGITQEEAAIEQLELLLETDVPDLRVEAAYAIWKIAGKEYQESSGAALATLLNGMYDESIVRKAIQYLCSMESDVLFDPIYKAEQEGDYDEMLQIVQRISKWLPHGQLHDKQVLDIHAGLALLGLKRFDDALGEFEKLLQQGTYLSSFVYEYMALALRGLGRDEEARNAEQEAEKLKSTE